MLYKFKYILQNVFHSNTFNESFPAVTPPDYQPPGFKEGECEGMIFEGEPMYLNVGEVPTPFHMLKVKVTTEKQRMENVDKSILKRGETNVPLQVIRVDRDDPEEENRDTNVRAQMFCVACSVGYSLEKGH